MKGTMYQVISDNFAGREPGDVLTADDLDGLNIDALIEGGHIIKTSSKKQKAEEN